MNLQNPVGSRVSNMPVDKMASEMFVYGRAKECRPPCHRDRQPELENCDVWEQLNRVSCDPCLPVRYLLPSPAPRLHCFPSCLRNGEGVKRTFFGRKSKGRKAGSKIYLLSTPISFPHARRSLSCVFFTFGVCHKVYIW